MNNPLQPLVYGQPTMPRDLMELAFYIEVQGKRVIDFDYQKIHDHYLVEPNGYVNLTKDLIVAYVIYTLISPIFSHIRGYGVLRSLKHVYTYIVKFFSSIFMALPFVKKQVDSELKKTIDTIDKSIILNDEKLKQFPRLPTRGLSHAEILQELDNLQNLKHSAWDKGRVSGAVYHGGDELLELQSDAYNKYSIANQLHPDVFPGVRKMESEVVSMVLKIFNAPDTGCGSTTSGGTESLLLTGLAAREYGKRHKGITKPEVIAPITVHAGIEKACYYFGMTLHKVDLGSDYKVDLKKVKKLINKNTVLLVGSAPNYPHGIVDDIEGLSKLAIKYNIPLHVDACLGSFIMGFLEKTDIHESLPWFDFRVPGVTSISCDTHKYGFAPKGSSVIMYRHKELRECQYYISSDWTGGMYGSPTLAGSRPGALTVGCWATLVNIGEEGYLNYCKEIVTASMKLKSALNSNEILTKNLEVIGDPLGSVISFKAKGDFSIYGLSDKLTSKGWHFATLQNPAALHFALTWLTVPIIEELIEDLVACTEEIANSTEKIKSDTASLYGVAGNVSTAGVADKIIVAFLDALYKLG